MRLHEKQLGISNERANVMLLTAVHCLPGGMDENKPNCMVRFSSLMDRDEVLQKEIALKSVLVTVLCRTYPPREKKHVTRRKNREPKEYQYFHCLKAIRVLHLLY